MNSRPRVRPWARSAADARPASVLCVGAATMDTIFQVSALPVGAGKILPLQAVEIAAGMAASAAVAIARLEGRATLCACVGEDAVGERIVAGLTAEGVDCRLVRRAPGARSAFATILVDPRGDRLVVPYYDPRLFSGQDGLASMEVRAFDSVLTDVRWPAAAAALLAAARAVGIPGVLDADVVACETLSRLAPLASHAVFSEPAAMALSGASDIHGALDRLSRQLSGFVAVTAGAEGCFWVDRAAGRMRQIAAPAVTVVDTLAAGDTFHGAFALGLAEGRPIEDTVRFANIAAALKCTKFGGRSGTPTRAEVEQFLAGMEAPTGE